jgi:hypothetical protein
MGLPPLTSFLLFIDPAQTAGMAFVALNFSLPSVALEHSDAVKSVQCPSNNTMIVTFGSNNDLKYALQMWPSNNTDFILVSYFEGCGAHSSGERSYFAVGNFTSSNTTTSITAYGYNLDTIDAADYLSIEFGVYTPPNSMPPNVANPYGFTQAPLGDGFDELLDDLIGSVDINSTSSGAFATSLTTPDLEEVNDTEEETDEEAANDDFIFPDLNVTFVNATNSNATSKRTLKTPNIRRGPQKRQTFDPKVELSIEVPKDPKLEDSPFGKAIKIGEFSEDAGASGKMTVYCVDCGIKGNMNIKGHLEIDFKLAFIFQNPIMKAEINIDGGLSAGLSLGFDAQVLFTKEIKKQIAVFPISPLAIPGIASIGPQITLDIKATLTLNATGQLLVGATLNMPKPTTTIDFKNDKNSKSSGWDPEFKPVFKASGKIAASAELGFPIGVGVGINVLNGIINVKAALVDEPSLKATITLAGSVSLPPSKRDVVPLIEAPAEHRRDAGLIAKRAPSSDIGTTALALRDLTPRDDECDNGVELELKFINRIYLDLFGHIGDDLAHNEIPIAKKCFP